MSVTTGQSLASRNRWLVVAAAMLVIPGTLLSIALGGIGALLLIGLLIDHVLATRGGSRPRLPWWLQLLAAAIGAALIGSLIGLVAWII